MKSEVKTLRPMVEGAGKRELLPPRRAMAHGGGRGRQRPSPQRRKDIRTRGYFFIIRCQSGDKFLDVSVADIFVSHRLNILGMATTSFKSQPKSTAEMEEEDDDDDEDDNDFDISEVASAILDGPNGAIADDTCFGRGVVVFDRVPALCCWRGATGRPTAVPTGRALSTTPGKCGIQGSVQSGTAG